MADFHRMLARIDQQTQRREIDLVTVVAMLLEMPRQLLNASLRQSIRREDSLTGLVTIANGDFVDPTDHSDSVARLYVALA